MGSFPFPLHASTNSGTTAAKSIAALRSLDDDEHNTCIMSERDEERQNKVSHNHYRLQIQYYYHMLLCVNQITSFAGIFL